MLKAVVNKALLVVHGGPERATYMSLVEPTGPEWTPWAGYLTA